jgi:hypothetical protein
MHPRGRRTTTFARFVAMLAVLAVSALLTPLSSARAATVSVLFSKSGLTPGDYHLTVKVTTLGSPVSGVVVQRMGGQGPLLRVATFTATRQGTSVTADLRSSGSSDTFQVITADAAKATNAAVTRTTLGMVARGTQFIRQDGSPVVWHGINADPWMTVTDVADLHRTTAVNLVRIPVSECVWMSWSTSYRPFYKQHIIDLVNAVTANGMTAIVDLHWACHDDPAWQQPDFNTFVQVAPDQHSIGFWRDAAATFKSNPAVMFELFNEPQLVLGNTYGGKTAADVWLNGGTVAYYAWTWQAPGMQALYDAVRSTGAENVVLADGLEWASDLRMLTTGSALRGTNVGYAYHGYTHPGQAADAHTPYLDTMVWPSIDPAGRWAFPAIATEFGTPVLDPAATSYFNDTLAWFKAHGQSWTVWGWYPVGGDAYGLLTARPNLVTSRGSAVLAAF